MAVYEVKIAKRLAVRYLLNGTIKAVWLSGINEATKQKSLYVLKLDRQLAKDSGLSLSYHRKSLASLLNDENDNQVMAVYLPVSRFNPDVYCWMNIAGGGND